MQQLLESILDNPQHLEAHFQPIVSVRRKAIIGCEALARAVDPVDKSPIPPLRLFDWAAQAKRVVDLDRLCRRKAMEAFVGLPQDVKGLLFLNFEVSVLEQGVEGSQAIQRLAQEYGVHPGQVVLEINESYINDPEPLKRFVDNYRRMGFLIALDDLGTGQSNLPRVAGLKPDIIKLDRSLMENLAVDYHGREVVRGLVELAQKIGALVLAEGVEDGEHVQQCLNLGVDLLQGYYFAKPAPGASLKADPIVQKLQHSAVRYRAKAVSSLLKRRRSYQNYRSVLQACLDRLASLEPKAFEAEMKLIAEQNVQLECAYVLDDGGVQETATVFGSGHFLKARRGSLFAPAKVGADHSLKEYFYGLLEVGMERYTTNPYISLATGNICITLSAPFKDRLGRQHVLCLDLLPDREEGSPGLGI